MRTAICISGHVRNWRRTLPNFQEYLLDFFQKRGQVDIFISTWDTVWTKECWSPNYRFLDASFDRAGLEAAYRPRAMTLENLETLRPNFLVTNFTQRKGEIRHISNEGMLFSTPMFYKIRSANELKKAHENEHGFKYNRVIRYRFDTWFNRHIEHLLVENPKCIYIKTFNQNAYADDTFACGPSDLMDKYSDCYLHIGRALDNIANWGPERILYYYLKTLNIAINELPLDCMCICRKAAKNISIKGELIDE